MALGLKRGDIVIVAPPGEFGKPRPAVIVQADVEPESERVTVALITSDLHRLPALRVPLLADAFTGVRRPSEIAVDNLQTFSVGKIGNVVGGSTLRHEDGRSGSASTSRAVILDRFSSSVALIPEQ